MLTILNDEEDPSRFSETFLCLIPRVKKSKYKGEFRLISLCNVIYKVITKTVANRFEVFLAHDILVERYES